MRRPLRCFGLLGLLAAGCVSAQAEPVPVFVSIPPFQTFAERLGGDRVSVTAMVGPQDSPATYEPTPRQMAALAEAELFWRAGVPFEAAWLPRIRKAQPGLRVIDARAGIELRAMPSAAMVLGEGAHPNHDHEGEPDPHIWLDPANVKRFAGGFRDALIRARPESAAYFRERHAALIDDLEALDGDIRRLLRGLEHRRFMVFHPSWGYFAAAYGLEQIPIEIAGKSPGPRTLSRLIEKARAEQLRTVLVQPQFSRQDAETIARALDGRVLTADPLAPDYFANLRRVARTLAEALK